jgi:RNA polymerase sigma-70 factor (ECF subfamily)
VWLAPDGARINMKTSPHRGQFDATGSQDALERQLLNSVAAGEQEAIAELYELYFPRLFKFLYRLSHDYGLTEEIVNDVMLVVWRSADKFRGESKVSTWILGIAYRQCMKKLRKQRLPQAAGNEARDAVARGSDTIELKDVIAKALAELSPEHRMMIESVLYLGMTYREVAEIAGCPVNTAKTRVHNARKNLREILSRLGYVSGVKIDG